MLCGRFWQQVGLLWCGQRCSSHFSFSLFRRCCDRRLSFSFTNFPLSSTNRCTILSPPAETMSGADVLHMTMRIEQAQKAAQNSSPTFLSVPEKASLTFLPGIRLFIIFCSICQLTIGGACSHYTIHMYKDI